MYNYSSLYVHKIRVCINIPWLQRDWKTSSEAILWISWTILISPGFVHRTLSRSVCTLLLEKVVSRLFVMGIYATKFWFQISTSLRVALMFYISGSRALILDSHHMHGFYWSNSLFVFLKLDLNSWWRVEEIFSIFKNSSGFFSENKNLSGNNFRSEKILFLMSILI